MAQVELIMPKMGESVAEATIISWQKKVGDLIEVDETVVEIATDKVDSEIPSSVKGTLKEILFQVDDIVKVGETIAIIETAENNPSEKNNEQKEIEKKPELEKSINNIEKEIEKAKIIVEKKDCLLYTSPSPRDISGSRMPSSA